MKLARLKLEIMFLYFHSSITLFVRLYLLEMISSVIFFFLSFCFYICSLSFIVPPYGQEDLQDLQSIFEIAHLRKQVLFLNTQCQQFNSNFFFFGLLLSVDRMPPQIGRVISEAVYEHKLKSNSLHPITDEVLACRFIDVPGVEKKNPSSGSIVVCSLIYLLYHNI
jgi:hypothetical protein